MASALMSIGTRAMTANYAALQTTGHNIANANVDGYSRQQLELETSTGQFTGAGFFGKGVDVATVTRSHDAFLTREAAAASSLSALDRARLEQLERLEGVFPLGESGLGHAAGEFLNAMVDLASHPQDPSTRQVVLARAGDVAARFADAASRLDGLQAGVRQDLQASVAQVNGLAARIAQVNQQVAAALGTGHTPNDLLDQRDGLVADLSKLVQVSTIAADDGTLGVFIAGGQRLVLGNQAATLQVASDPMDSSRAARRHRRERQRASARRRAARRRLHRRPDALPGRGPRRRAQRARPHGRGTGHGRERTAGARPRPAPARRPRRPPLQRRRAAGPAGRDQCSATPPATSWPASRSRSTMRARCRRPNTSCARILPSPATTCSRAAPTASCAASPAATWSTACASPSARRPPPPATASCCSP